MVLGKVAHHPVGTPERRKLVKQQTDGYHDTLVGIENEQARGIIDIARGRVTPECAFACFMEFRAV
jgi:hypothetical protein